MRISALTCFVAANEAIGKKQGIIKSARDHIVARLAHTLEVDLRLGDHLRQRLQFGSCIGTGDLQGQDPGHPQRVRHRTTLGWTNRAGGHGAPTATCRPLTLVQYCRGHSRGWPAQAGHGQAASCSTGGSMTRNSAPSTRLMARRRRWGLCSGRITNRGYRIRSICAAHHIPGSRKRVKFQWIARYGSKWETGNEIASHQALDRHRRS